MNIRSILIAVILIGIAAILYFLYTDANDSNTHQSNIANPLANDPAPIAKQNKEKILSVSTNAALTKGKLTPENFDVVSFMQWRSDRGHFDGSSQTDYSNYSVETLSDLVVNRDRLAMLTLAQMLSIDEHSEQRVIDLYEEAAVLGYTYALTRLADFKLSNKVYRREQPNKLNAEGQLSDQFVDGLKYLAAAELSGDPFMLAAFSYQTRDIDPDVLKQGLPRICAEGQNALNALEAKRQALGLKEFKHSEQVLQVVAQEFNYKPWCTKE